MIHHEQSHSSNIPPDSQTSTPERQVSSHVPEQDYHQSENEPEDLGITQRDNHLAPGFTAHEDVLQEADQASRAVKVPTTETINPEEDQTLVPNQNYTSQIITLEPQTDTADDRDTAMPSGTATEPAEENNEEQDKPISDVDTAQEFEHTVNAVARDCQPSSSAAAGADQDVVGHGDSISISDVEPTSEKSVADTISPDVEEDRLTRVSSTDSFFTTNSLTEESLSSHVDAIDFQKTPHAEQLDPFAMKVRQHKRDVSELTVTASTIDSFLDTSSVLPSTSGSIDVPATPALAQSTTSDLSWPDVDTPSSPLRDGGVRRRLKMQRSLSPLPPSTTLFAPGSPTHGSHFTAAFLQKACTLALVKPMEAVVLLVHILARIAGGATVNDLLNGELFKRPEQHRRSSSFPDQASSPRDDTDDEDDFGVPFRGRLRKDASQAETSAVKDDDTDSMFDLD